MIARRPRGQRGMSLVELLLAVTIITVIGVPLTAWATTAIRGQGVADGDLGRANATGLLGSQFASDVVSAQLVQVAGVGGDCVGGDGPGGTVELTIISSGDNPRRIVYTEVADEGATAGLWRRECDLAGTGTRATLMFSPILLGNTTVTCPGAEPDGGGDPCDRDGNRQVQLSLRPEGVSDPVTVRATRRTTQDSTGIGLGGNYPPIGSIDVGATTGYTDTTFTFDAASSTDRDGQVVGTVWTFPTGSSCTGQVQTPQASCTFSQLGSNSVQLTVTDDQGGASTVVRTVDIRNRAPRAVASGPSEVQRAVPFTLDASQSTDPDPGDLLDYEWDLGEDLGGARYASGAQPTILLPGTAEPGSRQVTLSVTDAAGAVDRAVLIIQVDAPLQEGILVDPPLVAVSGRVPRVGTVGGVAPDLTVTFTPAEPAPAGGVGWRLYRYGTADVYAADAVAQSCPTGGPCRLTFGPVDAGSYEIVRLVDDGSSITESPRRSFRINRAPRATFDVRSVAGNAPNRVVGFTSSAAGDPDGAIISRLWDFGDGGSSTDPEPLHTYTAPGDYAVTLTVVDDDGATATTSTSYVVEGAPAAPGQPSFAGWVLGWPAVDGAEQYVVDLTYDCGPDPRTLRRTIVASPVPSLVVSAPSERCGAPGTVVATVRVKANGQLGPASPPVAGAG